MESLGNDLVVTLVLSVVGILWGAVQGSRWYQRLRAGRFAQAEELAEEAVLQVSREIVEDWKRASQDGKLTKEEIETAREKARNTLTVLASQKGLDLGRALGYRSVDLLLELAFARLKKAGALLALLLCCGLVFSGCAMTRVTSPDGTVTETRDLSPWAQQLVQSVVTQGTPYAMAWIERELDDTPKPLTEAERLALEQNAALRAAVVQALVANMQWYRDHPGQALPKDRVVDVAKIRAKMQTASANPVGME
jgi:hypothetical protein